jgi:hypothetical protein
MTTAQDLFAQGSHAFAEDDYEEALNFYSQAIEVNGTHAEIFLKRYVLCFFFLQIHSFHSSSTDKRWMLSPWKSSFF